MLLLRIYLFCCIFVGLPAAALLAQSDKIAGVVYLRTGEQITAQKIQHFWLMGRGGWLVVDDTTGQRRKIFDKDVEGYHHKGNHFRSILRGKNPQHNRSYVMWVRFVTGRVNVYGEWGASNDHIPSYYIQSAFYTGIVTSRSFRTVLLPLLKEQCAVFAERAEPNAKADMLLQIEVFNRICPQ